MVSHFNIHFRRKITSPLALNQFFIPLVNFLLKVRLLGNQRQKDRTFRVDNDLLVKNFNLAAKKFYQIWESGLDN